MVSLSASVAWWARTEPDRTALVYANQRVSYGDLQDRVEAAAGLLAAQGIRPGDVVALLMKNSAAFIELALAVSHAGAVLLPINYRLGADEVGDGHGLYLIERHQVVVTLGTARILTFLLHVPRRVGHDRAIELVTQL